MDGMKNNVMTDWLSGALRMEAFKYGCVVIYTEDGVPKCVHSREKKNRKPCGGTRWIVMAFIINMIKKKLGTRSGRI